MTYRWRLAVEDRFQISERGLIVVGAFEGQDRQGDAAQVEVEGAPFLIDHVWFEVLTQVREGSPAILLGHLDKDRVPIGTVIHSIEDLASGDG